MRTVALTKPHTCTVYESIFELPEGRRIEFNSYLVQDLGVGADYASVERHFANVTAFLAAGQAAEAIEEVANLHYNLNFMLEKFSPQSLAFGVLVAEVDGVPATDLTESGLTALRDRLSALGLTAGLVEAEVATVKKNCKRS